MATVTRTKTWVDNTVLSASDLNAEFNNLLNALALVNADISGSAAIAASKIALDTDGTLAANSDTTIASQKATKTYIDSGTTAMTNKTLGSGTTDATQYTPVTFIGGPTTRLQSQVTAGCSTSATVILTGPLYLTFALVYGSDGTNRFSDVILMSVGSGTVNVISSLSAAGSPSARTYSQSSSTLKVAMGSGTYTVKVAAFTLSDS